MGAGQDLIDAYEVLGVSPDASQAELKAAHRRLVRRHHPDLQPPEQRPQANERVQRINVSYGLVRDPRSRRDYDLVRAAHRRRATVEAADTELARRWQSLLDGAGRWAGRWWARNRRAVERAAIRAHLTVRHAGRLAFARVLWLGYSVLGAFLGVVLALGAARFALETTGAATPAVGLLAGWVMGSAKGRRLHRRMAGLPAPPRPLALVTVLVLLAVTLGVGLDVWLARSG